MKGIGHMVTTRARAARLGMAALVVAMAIGATGCSGSGMTEEPARDPLADIGLIEMPTPDSVTGSAAVGASNASGTDTIGRFLEYVNDFNSYQTVQAPNAFLEAIKERLQAGQDLTEPFTMEVTFGSNNNFSMQATFRRIDDGGTTRFVGWYDQTPHPATLEDPNSKLEDAPFELVFTDNFRRINAIAGVGPTGVLMVEYNYETGNGFYMDNGANESLYREGFYALETFASTADTYTYSVIETDSDTDESDRVVAHVIAGNGIVHFLDDEDGDRNDDGNKDDVTTYSGVDGTGSAGDQSALDTAFAAIEKGSDRPETVWNSRASLIPDFNNASAYTELLGVHRENF